MEANRIWILFAVVIIAALTPPGRSLSVADYVQLGKTCDPTQQNSGIVDSPKWYWKVCFPGTYCNPHSKLCDCADSADGKWKRTFRNRECRLLPGSVCIPNVDQEFYNCVDNSKCTITRRGEDTSRCAADAPCDSGDAECICEPGKKCLTQVVPATATAM